MNFLKIYIGGQKTNSQKVLLREKDTLLLPKKGKQSVRVRPQDRCINNFGKKSMIEMDGEPVQGFKEQIWI